MYTEKQLKILKANIRVKVSGPTGTGKTRILNIVLNALMKNGYTIFQTTNREHEIAIVPKKE